jgi:sulfate transport system permease protein
LPLHIEVSYNEYDVIGAFSSASILAALAIVTLILKSFLEWKQGKG